MTQRRYSLWNVSLFDSVRVLQVSDPVLLLGLLYRQLLIFLFQVLNPGLLLTHSHPTSPIHSKNSLDFQIEYYSIT